MSAVPIHELLDLSGRTALVTGASGTIGSAIARRLHEAGAAVAVHAATRGEAARAIAAELGDRAIGLEGDVERDAERLCEEVVAGLGDLDLVVNNAGIQPVRGLLDLTAAERSEMLRVNVGGVMALTTVAARHMVDHGHGGAIVNIASIEGLQPARNHSHYTSSKAAVIMHTRSAALELGRHGIRVNAVAPGLIEHDTLRDDWPSGVERWLTACPLGRMGTGDDIADAVLFLLSPAGRWISGATLVVDGGTTTNNVW